MLLGLLHQTDRLDGQDRKHAGHQIQNQPAEHGEQHQRDEHRGPCRRGGRARRRELRRSRRRGCGRAAEGRSDLDGHRDGFAAALSGRAALLGRDQNAADVPDVRRLIAELHGEIDGAVAPAQRLRGGILDHAVVEGIERQRLDAGRASSPQSLPSVITSCPSTIRALLAAGAAPGSSLRARSNSCAAAGSSGPPAAVHRQRQIADRRSRECRRPHTPASLPSP